MGGGRGAVLRAREGRACRVTTYVSPIKRPLAFTVYPKAETYIQDEADCGRVIIAGQNDTPIAQGEWLAGVGDVDLFLSRLNKQDILWVPLYACHIDQPVDWPCPRLADYEAHHAILKAAAPLVQAVMVGNMGCETRFFRQSCTVLYGRERAREGAEFVKYHSDLIRSAGGRPCFGTVDWDLMADCYEHGIYADAIREADALQICFCAFTFVQGAYCDRSRWYYKRQLPWLSHQGDPEQARLKEYIRSMDVLTGIGRAGGFVHENDRVMKDFGFIAGTSGGMKCKTIRSCR